MQRRQNNYQTRSKIEDVLKQAGIHPGGWARSAHLQRAEPGEEGANETFRWVLTTEKPTVVFDWQRWELVEEILLADGMLVPAVGQVPLLDSHNRYSVKDVLGHVRDFSEGTSSGHGARLGMVHFAADPSSREALQKVSDGHITDGSVGYQQLKSVWVPAEEEVSIGGRLFVGPVRVTYQWLLKEFSITPIGADVLAKVERLCGAAA